MLDEKEVGGGREGVVASAASSGPHHSTSAQCGSSRQLTCQWFHTKEEEETNNGWGDPRTHDEENSTLQFAVRESVT